MIIGLVVPAGHGAPGRVPPSLCADAVHGGHSDGMVRRRRAANVNPTVGW